MPFNGSGNFTIINIYVPNTTILSTAVNQNFADIATGLSDCLTRDGQAGMTAVFKAISGSLAAPSITFTADATSGLYLSNTGIVGFVAHSLGMLLNTTIFQATSATVQAGGSGYAVGDTFTPTGGTVVSQPVFQVATLSGSAVATVTVVYPGVVTATATNPVSQGSTSGIGSGCTLNVTYNDPTSSDYRAFLSDQAGGFLWQKLGASPYVAGLMESPTALSLAQGIGGTALTQVIGGTFLIDPQGILSPVSTSLPIPTSDQAAVTRIYWTPYKGNVCPIYNGTSFVATTSAQIFCDLTSGAQALGGIYDVYKFLSSGVVTLGLSPSWSAGTSGSVTAGSCARGTGTGGTALSLLNGILTNAVSMTLNNSSTTYTVPANQATYLGSVYINAVAGQYNCLLSYGQSRAWGLWNANNRRPIIMQAGDPTGSWIYNTNTIRPSNNSAANSITTFTGLAEEPITAQLFQFVLGTASANSNGDWLTGIGWNSTTAFSGLAGEGGLNTGSGGPTSTVLGAGIGQFINPPALGINVATSLETSFVGTGSSSVTYKGTATNMVLSTNYRG